MTRRIRNCVCAWLRRHNKSLRGNVIQICSPLQINFFYNLHKGVWRIKYSKYNNNNIVATKEVSLKSASKKRNPLVVVLLFHGVCNIKIELNLLSPEDCLSTKVFVIHISQPPLMSYLLLFLQQVDFSRAITDGEVIPTKLHIGNSCVSTFAVKSTKLVMTERRCIG